jgi:hypothetical protein
VEKMVEQRMQLLTGYQPEKPEAGQKSDQWRCADQWVICFLCPLHCLGFALQILQTCIEEPPATGQEGAKHRRSGIPATLSKRLAG